MANIIEITDFMSPELDVYARLTENQLLNRHEPEKGLFIAESPNVVERALNAGYTPVKSVFTYLPTAINDQLLADFQLVLAGNMTAQQMAEDLDSYQKNYEASLG